MLTANIKWCCSSPAGFIDSDASGYISMEEFSPDIYSVLMSFKQWASSLYGSVGNAFKNFDKEGNGTLTLSILRRSCQKGKWSGDAQQLFQCVGPTNSRQDPNKKLITVDDVAFLDLWPDREKEEKLEDEESCRSPSPKSAPDCRPHSSKKLIPTSATHSSPKLARFSASVCSPFASCFVHAQSCPVLCFAIPVQVLSLSCCLLLLLFAGETMKLLLCSGRAGENELAAESAFRSVCSHGLSMPERSERQTQTSRHEEPRRHRRRRQFRFRGLSMASLLSTPILIGSGPTTVAALFKEGPVNSANTSTLRGASCLGWSMSYLKHCNGWVSASLTDTAEEKLHRLGTCETPAPGSESSAS